MGIEETCATFATRTIESIGNDVWRPSQTGKTRNTEATIFFYPDHYYISTSKTACSYPTIDIPLL